MSEALAVVAPDGSGQATDPPATCSAVRSSGPERTATVCKRPAEWCMTGRAHNGTAVVVGLACMDTMCRGMVTASAWHERDVATVEVRMLQEIH